jgi:hypothetical protein
MTSDDSEYWTENSQPFEDLAGQQWPLNDSSLANSDHIAFEVKLGSANNRIGLSVNLAATTVSYDPEGLRHVQTSIDWVNTESRPLDADAADSNSAAHALALSLGLPSAHVDYDLLARQVLHPAETNRDDEGGSTMNRHLCERAMVLANAINQLSETYVPSTQVTDDFAVLDCIYVARTTPSVRRAWRDVGYPNPDSPLSQHRRTRYSHQERDGSHVMTLCHYGRLRDYAEDDEAQGECLTVDKADLDSRALAVLADEVSILDRAAREIKPGAERHGRSLSVTVQVES